VEQKPSMGDDMEILEDLVTGDDPLTRVAIIGSGGFGQMYVVTEDSRSD